MILIICLALYIVKLGITNNWVWNASIIIATSLLVIFFPLLLNPKWYLSSIYFLIVYCIVLAIPSKLQIRSFNVSLNDLELKYFSRFTGFVGLIGYFLLTISPEELKSSTQWEGSVTIYFFLASFCKVYLASYIVRGHKTIIDKIIFCFCAYYLFNRVFIEFRREEAIFLAGLFLFRFLFLRGKSLSKRYILLAPIGLFLFANIGIIRALGRSKVSIGRALEVLNESQNIVDIISRYSLELLNYVNNISIIANTSAFSYGLFYWNAFIWDYLPGQLLPSGMKESLFFNLNVKYSVSEIGTTNTGLVDSFQSFGWFGAGVFAIIVVSFNMLVNNSTNKESKWRYILIMVLFPKLFLAVTHTTAHYFNYWLMLTIFCLSVRSIIRVFK